MGRLRDAAIVAAFAVGAVLMTWPLTLHLSTSLVGGDDPLLNSWILAWDAHALSTDPPHLYDGNIFFPFPMPLTYSETLLSGALLVAPIQWTTGNPVLAHNVLTLASLTLAGVSVYLLVLELTGDALAGAIAGCVFAFSGYQQDQLIHLQLLQSGWLGLAILYLHRAVRRSRSIDFVLFGLFFVCEAWASYYLLFIESVALTTFLIVEALTGQEIWRTRNVLRLAATFGTAGLLVLVPAGPYLQTQQTFRFQWPVDIVQAFSASPTDYLSVSPHRLLYPAPFSRFENSNFPAEHALFPGVVVLALGGLAVITLALVRHLQGPTNGREIVRYLSMVLVAFVLSFGPRLSLLNGTPAVATPYHLMTSFVPGFAAMRVPARFNILVLFGLSVLAGIGLAWLRDVLRTRVSRHARMAVLAFVAGSAIIELLPAPRSLTRVQTGAEVPGVYRWLKDQDPGAVVAEIPNTTLANFNYVYLSTYHWHPLVNGISGFNPPQSNLIFDQLDQFPDETAINNLRSLGVRYVVVHEDALDAHVLEALNNADLPRLRMRVAATLGWDLVYELAPPQQQAVLQDHAKLELPTVVDRGLPAAAVLTVTNDTADPVALARTQTIYTDFATNDTPAQRSHLSLLPVFIQPGDRLTQAIPVPLETAPPAEGQARVHVHVTGAVDLESSAVIQFADLPTSRQKDGLAAAISGVRVPRVIHAGSVVQISLVARNAGRAVWLAGTGAGSGQVGAAVRRWIGLAGQAADAGGQDLGSAAAHLDWNVNPGQQASYSINARAPAAAGHYEIVLDMLSENVTWFDDVDSGVRTVVPVDVLP